MPPVSKFAKLPAEVRAWLERTFVERAFGDIVSVTEELNEICKRGGVAMSFGKSAVGAESLRIKRAQESIAATTRSMQLIADTAPDEADKRGEALNAMVSQGVFEVLLDVQQAGAEDDPADRMALLNKAALAAGRLTTTSVRQRQWRAQVEDKAKAAAEAVTKIARTGGLKPDQVREIRSQILGIAQRAAQAITTPT